MSIALATRGMLAPAAASGTTVYVPVVTVSFKARMSVPKFRCRFKVI